MVLFNLPLHLRYLRSGTWLLEEADGRPVDCFDGWSREKSQWVLEAIHDKAMKEGLV